MKTITLTDSCLGCRMLIVDPNHPPTGSIKPKQASIAVRAIKAMARAAIFACSLFAGYAGQDAAWTMNVDSFSDGNAVSK